MNPPLFAHQEVVADRVASGEPTAIYCEQGTGKTRAFLEGLVRLPDPWPALVICPKSVMGVWATEARRWVGVEAVLVRGGAKKREKLFRQEGKLWVINFEALRATSKEVRRVIDGRQVRWLENPVRTVLPWRTVAVDESSRIKHGTTTQSRTVHAFAGVRYRAILSGTAITHSPLDLWSQFRFLVPDLFPRNFRVFREPYVIVTRRPIPGGVSRRGYTHFDEVVAYRDLEKLYAAVAPHVVRFTKAECLDLPPKLYHRIPVDLSEDQRTAYDELKETMIAEVGDGVVVAANALARAERLQEICQGRATREDGVVYRFPTNAKLEAIEDVLEAALGAGGDRKAVVWCRYLRDMADVLALAEKLGAGAVEIRGATSGPARDEAVLRFQEDPRVRVFVGQEQAAGFGLTLTAASTVVFYSQDWNLDDRQQAEDRAHRIGTHWPVEIVDLVCRRTVDESVVRNLLAKRRFAERFDAATLRRLLDGEDLNGTEDVEP